MIPVYLSSTHRGTRKLTEVCKIQGNLHKLEKDIKQAIEHISGKPVASQINELVGIVRFKGDYTKIVKDFLIKKGF